MMMKKKLALLFSLLLFSTLSFLLVTVIVFNDDELYIRILLDGQLPSLYHDEQQRRRLQVGWLGLLVVYAYINGIVQIIGRASCLTIGVGTCICSLDGLVSFLESSKDTAILTRRRRQLCSDTTIRITESDDPIDITGVNASLACNYALRFSDEIDYRSCKIESAIDRAFVGAPTGLIMEKIDFYISEEEDEEDDKAYSFMHLTGGYASFSEMFFVGGTTTTTSSNSNGGAILLSNDASLYLGFGILFDANTAAVANGGAIALQDDAFVSMYFTAFRDNVATNNGGAIYVQDNARVQLQYGVYFLRNTAAVNGGAIAVVGDGNEVTIGGLSIFLQDNIAQTGFGNTIYINTSSSTATTGTLVNCTSSEFSPFSEIVFCSEDGDDFGIYDATMNGMNGTNCAEKGSLANLTANYCNTIFVDAIADI